MLITNKLNFWVVYPLLLLMLPGCGYHILNRPPSHIPSESTTTRLVPQGCYAIKIAPQQYLAPNGNGYALDGIDPVDPSTGFFFQYVPGSISDYYILDRDQTGKSSFLAASFFGPITRQSELSWSTRWIITRTDGTKEYSYQLVSAKAPHEPLQISLGLPQTPLTLNLVGDARCLQTPDDPQGALNTNAHIHLKQSPGHPLWGLAELHNHMFAYLGFGGAAVVGRAYSDNFAAEAFPDDWDIHPFYHVFDLPELAAQQHHGNAGFPSFSGYPTWYTMDHQQVYYRWLERAYRGGLRLMTMLAVNNEVMCETLLSTKTHLYSCDDMEAVKRQIDEARQLEIFIDRLSGGKGKGWFRIVTSPKQARDVIEDGKLAVVLGVEVSNLLDCSKSKCTADYVDQEVDKLHALGVRQVFIVHEHDNEFGGAAFFNEMTNLSNYLATGDYFESDTPTACYEAGFAFESDEWMLHLPRMIPLLPLFELNKLNPLRAVNAALTGTHYELPRINVLRVLGLFKPGPFYSGPQCNNRGIQEMGAYLITRLMDKHIIIDIDHMSNKSANNTLDLVEKRKYPVVSGHSKFLELSAGKAARNEFTRTKRQVERIRDLGGIVAPMLAGATREDRVNRKEYFAIDCSKSSQSWAQSYLYAVAEMSTNSTVPNVAMGSDFNGFTDHIAPRFGNDACAKDETGQFQQNSPVVYPFDYHEIAPFVEKGQEFDRHKTGTKVWDYNVDGLAHIGLLPDFIADLKQIGLTRDDLTPLFSSAEAYIAMWECIEDERVRLQQGCRRRQSSIP